MFKACWSLGKEDFTIVEALRGVLGVPADELDEYAAHVYVADEDGAPIAAGRIYPLGDALHIDRIIAAEEYASLPYEELTLRILLYRARELPQEFVEVESTPAIDELLVRFGFSPKKDEPAMFRCARAGITWFSQCKD